MPNRPSILLVDDERENLKALDRSLRSSYEVVTCDHPLEAIEQIKQKEFAVVVSDQRMPDMSGTELLSRIAKISPLTSRIVLTAFTDTWEILDAINRAEIYRYITKPWQPEELLNTIRQATENYSLMSENRKLIAELESKNAVLIEKEGALNELNQKLESIVESRTKELKIANEQLNSLAMTDPLTRLLNRRAFFNKFAEEIDRSKRYGHTFAVAMIDVDHFKPFNDLEGHLLGDEVLQRVADILSTRIRKSDVLCRYGGEEFCLMMPETKLSVGKDICERLRAAVECKPIQGQFSTFPLTISLGLSGYPEHGQTVEMLIERADRALYEAKETGRNRVVVNE